MSKRFTDTDKWEDSWYMNLTIENKLFYNFLLDKCNTIGLWKPNLRLAEFILGYKIDHKKFIKELGKDRIYILKNGYWWLIKFCDFQYGVINEESTSKPIQSYINLLKKHNLWIPYLKGIDTLKEKDKDKDKVKEKDKDKEDELKISINKVIYPFDSGNFIKVWDAWKKYKKDEHSFKYKTTISEQAALSKLNRISECDEGKATLIIFNSIADGYKGFFPLKKEDLKQLKKQQDERELDDLERKYAAQH